MQLGMAVGLGRDHIVLDGDPAPLPKKGMEPPPQFSAHVYCGQMAGWIKVALGMEVGLGPAHLSKRGQSAPIFSPFLLWPNGWMQMPLGMEVGLGPGDFVRWGPSPCPKSG